MPKIKLTKNELKNQRDALKRFERYLPTLQLKKQQLQLEVRQARERLRELDEENERVFAEHSADIALFAALDPDAPPLMTVTEWRVKALNIAGADVPAFGGLEVEVPERDLFVSPIWEDTAADLLKQQTEVRLRRQLLVEQLSCIEEELRTVTQRVNLFEKVKIPGAQENIRRINIYIGDQQTNSVGRSKIAKAKCQSRDADSASQTALELE
ncbi:MAG: V-type ATP synthase subunit D [Victivallales bacterium]|nr:V-type ATP synthase subunit D [Victivallales bacterium]